MHNTLPIVVWNFEVLSLSLHIPLQAIVTTSVMNCTPFPLYLVPFSIHTPFPKALTTVPEVPFSLPWLATTR